MLQVVVQVNELTNYLHRRYALPEYAHLLSEEREDNPVEGLTPGVFDNIDPGNPIPKLLAIELFKIEGLKSVRMSRRGMSLLFSEGINPSIVDQQVILALNKIMAQTVQVSIRFADSRRKKDSAESVR